MKIAMIIIRTLMGALLLFASIAYFFKLGVPKTPPPRDAMVYNQGLAIVNLMFYVKVIELLCGIALITGRFVKLATIVIFPIVLNIVLFHAVVLPATMVPAVFLLAGNLFLAYYYRETYAPLFSVK